MAVEINGWRVMAHPLMIEQLLKLVAVVRAEKVRDPVAARSSSNTKLLAALTHLIFMRVPDDPLHKDYRQGDTLGGKNKHWFRAKFGQARFRLFFRCSTKHRTIIFAWVNDEETLRAHGSRKDAYRVFQGMLAAGNPPTDWEKLLAAFQAGQHGLDDLRQQIERLVSRE